MDRPGADPTEHDFSNFTNIYKIFLQICMCPTKRYFIKSNKNVNCTSYKYIFLLKNIYNFW
jgi:hypothetical protein